MIRGCSAALLLAVGPGCVAVTVVETAVDVTTTVVGTTVDVTAGVVEGTADLVTGDDEDEDGSDD